MKSLNIVITGASSGIGLATTQKYLALGHQVFGFSRTIDTLNNLKKTYPKTLHIFEGDISSLMAIDKFYEFISSNKYEIDIVIANAGIAKATAISDVNEDNFNETFNINVKGVFFTIQKALNLLSKQAAVLIVGSIQANKGNSVWATYGASKAAVRSLTRSFAEELANRGIRVNCLSPGVTQTPIFNKFGFKEEELTNIIKHAEQAIPLGRLGSPNEIADAIYFLCSEQASFITGVDLQVDGGLIQL